MNVISENVLDTSMRIARPVVEAAIEHLVEYGRKIVEDVKEEYMPILEDLVKNFTGEIKGVAFGKEVGRLDMPTLVSFAKTHIAPKSNEIVAMKVKQEDCYFIYLAYSKDRQLLPIADNKYVIIKAQALSNEVEALFVESELVIIK